MLPPSVPEHRKTSGSLLDPVARGFVWGGLLCFAAVVLFRDLRSGEQARKAQAERDSNGICVAIKQYYTEYGHYPLGAQGEPADGSQPDILFGATSGQSNATVFDILRNIDSTGRTPPGQPNQYNPRGIVFFDGRNASDPKAPRAGFVPPGAKSGTVGAFMDPWGHDYGIIMDAGNRNQITNLPYEDLQGPENGPHVGVAVFSLGKDGVVGSKATHHRYRLGDTISDDLISWH